METRGYHAHGDTRGGKWAPEYSAWKNMWQRCYDPSNVKYSRYGGRGITICDEWVEYPVFLADMGRRPTELHTLDRRNNDLGYSKGNCRWVTQKEQCRNRCNTKLNETKAAEIRNLYATGRYAQRELAAQYGVNQPNISKIILGKKWE